jgi:hypothetical protein
VAVDVAVSVTDGAAQVMEPEDEAVTCGEGWMLTLLQDCGPVPQLFCPDTQMLPAEFAVTSAVEFVCEVSWRPPLTVHVYCVAGCVAMLYVAPDPAQSAEGPEIDAAAGELRKMTSIVDSDRHPAVLVPATVTMPAADEPAVTVAPVVLLSPVAGDQL